MQKVRQKWSQNRKGAPQSDAPVLRVFNEVRHFLTHLYEDMKIYITLGEPPMFWLAKIARGLSSVAKQR